MAEDILKTMDQKNKIVYTKEKFKRRRIMKKEDSRLIHIKLKEYLDEHNIPLQWLEDATGIRYATLLDIYHCKRESINLIYLDMIMDALNISDMNLIMERG